MDHLFNVIAARDAGKLKGLERLKIMVFPERPAGVVDGGRFRPQM